MGFNEGYLDPMSSYWDTFAVKVSKKDTIINTDTPEGELQYLFLKGHKRVADGMKNISPSTDYVLINKDDEAVEINKASKIKRDAYKAFDKMTLEDMRKCLRLYGHKADNISNEVVESKLFELIDKDPSKFFLVWVNNKNKETQYLLETAVSKNIIRKSKNVYYYGTDIIGRTTDDAIAFLNNKENQEIKLSILDQIEAKQ